MINHADAMNFSHDYYDDGRAGNDFLDMHTLTSQADFREAKQSEKKKKGGL